MASSTRTPDPRRLDVAAFAVAGGELRGDWPATQLRRLLSATMESPADAGRLDVAWQAHGERLPLVGAGRQPSLRLEADTEVTLECQRCLQPMRWPLQARRRIFFVEGEDAAAALDAENDDDVLALVPVLDLQALIEDELLLALPIVPRHEVCPEPLPRAFVEDEVVGAPEDNPFAVLAALKRGSAPN
jgi:uncharacterized protein